jgi:hypothetical protein
VRALSSQLISSLSENNYPSDVGRFLAPRVTYFFLPRGRFFGAV